MSVIWELSKFQPNYNETYWHICSNLVSCLKKYIWSHLYHSQNIANAMNRRYQFKWILGTWSWSLWPRNGPAFQCVVFLDTELRPNKFVQYFDYNHCSQSSGHPWNRQFQVPDTISATSPDQICLGMVESVNKLCFKYNQKCYYTHGMGDHKSVWSYNPERFD